MKAAVAYSRSLAAGKATFTTSTLAVGSHTSTASYGGDAVNAASTSTAITVTITAAPVADFTISLNIRKGITPSTTPSGAYVITVTATFGSLIHNATYTISVQ